MKHLALFNPTLIEDILTGKVKVEIRYSKTKIAPFGTVSAGDIVYMKPASKEVLGQYKVKKVIFYDGFSEEDAKELKDKYGIKPNVTKVNYATLIFVGQANRFITSPIKLPKKDVRGWIVLG